MKLTMEKRSEPRTIVDEYYSVQFFITELEMLYHFILWDISSHGMCILIEKDSRVLGCLSEGKEFRMKYFPRDLLGATRIVKTRICHITEGRTGRFRDYCLVGLAILEQDR
ncbi:MAG: PilZ domain-containing protein [Thermodesulfobacteriota bacterium]